MKSLKMLITSVFDAFRARDQKKLRKLNDSILMEAGLDFTPAMYDLAVLSYILSKIVSKPRFLKKESRQYLRAIEDNIREVIRLTTSGDEKAVLDGFSRVSDSISSLERVDPRFVRNLVSKGRLKTAATMYAQGISLGLASQMTGISKQDILDYASKTMMFDRVKEEIPVKERLKAARRAVGASQ